MEPIAYALPIVPAKELELQAHVQDLEDRRAEYDALRGRLGVTREAVFLQKAPQVSYVITYRELEKRSAGNGGRSRPCGRPRGCVRQRGQ